MLGDKGGNVGLECSSSETHDDDTENEDTERSVGVFDDRGSSGGDKDQVTNLGDKDGVENGFETTEVGIGDPGSEQRADVDPEGVEGGQTESDLLAHVQGTRLGFSIAGIKRGARRRCQGLGDEVGIDGDGSIVTHALDQFNKGNLIAQSAACLACALHVILRTVKIFHGILAGTRRRVASSSGVGKSSASSM